MMSSFGFVFLGNVLRPPVCVKDGFAGRGLLGLVLFVFQPSAVSCRGLRPPGLCVLAHAVPYGWTAPLALSHWTVAGVCGALS